VYERQYDSATTCYYDGVRKLIWMCVVVAACDQGAKPAPPAKTSEAKVEPTRAFDDPLALLPVDSDFVFRIDTAALRRTPLWDKYAARVFGALLPRLANCAGYDPLAEVATVTGALNESPKQAILIFRGIDRDKTMRCLQHAPNDYVTVTGKNPEQSYVLAFVDGNTMVVQGWQGVTTEVLRSTLQVGAPLRQRADVVAAQKQLPAGASMTMIMPAGSKVLAKSAGVGVKMQQMTGSARVSERLDMEIVMTLANNDGASQLAKMLQEQLKSAKSMFDKIEARNDGDKVRLSIGMTEAQVTQIASLLEPQF